MVVTGWSASFLNLNGLGYETQPSSSSAGGTGVVAGMSFKACALVASEPRDTRALVEYFCDDS